MLPERLPETDFIIQPWIRESYGRELAHGDVVVGCSAQPGKQHAVCKAVAGADQGLMGAADNPQLC